ncbi:DUF927 domain-containing protein [Edwardsiella ictaluri]|uniref:DUF927 domain-containing protein n=1 Tax=Edwardsiella ictaluri TaxID=67780 RepID=UPI0039F6E775
MNEKMALSPLSTVLSNCFSDDSLNAFLANRASHEEEAKKHLNNARSIDIDIDEIIEDGYRDGLPDSFINTSKGLFYDNGKKVFQVASTAIVPVDKYYSACKTRNMGVELMTINHAGACVCASISLYTATVNIDDVMASLAGKGFGVISTMKAKELMLQFLQACMNQDLALPTYLVADAMGFVPDKKAFLHGQMPIAQHIPGFNYLIPGVNVPKGVMESGSLDEWKRLVKAYVYGWPQVFALCVAFASTLVTLCRMDVAMFHFYGGSTTGKTILLQLAMSVHGHGGEPGSAPGVNILRWNTTANALEKNLSQFSGLLACIDELGAYKQKDFPSLLYNLTAGQGKSRMDKSLGVRASYIWNLLILSSGEMSIPEKLATQKELLQGGQEHRAISLHVVPEDARKEGESQDKVRVRAEGLKNGLGEIYGTAGKAFIANLLTAENDEGQQFSCQGMADMVQEGTTECFNALLDVLHEKGYSPSDIQKRALKRFALCRVAGELAKRWGILPFTGDEVEQAVVRAACRWLDDKPNQYNPLVKALTAIQLDLIKTSAAHFTPLLDEDAYTPSNHWGYIDKQGDMMIFAPVFDDWCIRNGLKPADVAKALAQKKYLKPESQGHYKKRPQKGIKNPFYLVKETFLSCNIEADF